LREFANINTQLYCLEHGIQPDGYLTEERKAKDDDHGFSTFFSETGMSL
jgi:tubulin alpha